MSDMDSLRLLEDWRGNWRHSELWRIASKSAPPDGFVIVQSVLELISRPPEPLEVFRMLVEQGSFTDAEALLNHPPFVEAIDDVLIGGGDSDLDLDNRRLLARGEVLGAMDVLLIRNRRAGSPITADDPRLDQALEWSSRDKRHALGLLADLERTVLRAELERTEVFQLQLAERLAREGDNVPSNWREAVERSLARRQLDIAEALLAGQYGQQVDVGLAPPQPLENARFADAPPTQLLGWVLRKEKAPPDFYARWDVLAVDASNLGLMEIVDRLCSADASEYDVAHFVAELERRLNIKAPPAAVERFENGFRTTIRGLEDEACPAFAEGALPFFVVRNGTIGDDATRGIRLAVVFDPVGELQLSTGYAVLTPWDILRCLVRLEDFRFNLLRILSRQLNRHRLIPARPPRNWMESARAADAQTIVRRSARMPQLVSGANGIGKTSLLHSVLTIFGDEGWTCRFISDASQLLPFDDPFNGDPVSKCALAVDNGHEFDHSTFDRLLANAKSVTGRRLVVCGSPALGRQTHSSIADEAHYRLSLVAFSSIRAFAERLFDVYGHPVAAAVLDRVAFYAAGRPALLYALVYALFLELGQRPIVNGAAISVDHVETAYGRSEFRDAARSILLTPLESDARANLVLATILIVMELEITSSPVASVALDRVIQWLEMEGIVISPREWLDAINYLRELELIDTDSAGLRVALSAIGGGFTLVSLLPENRFQYFSDVRGRMAR